VQEKSFHEAMTANQRMLVLRALYKDSDYTLSTDMLQRFLRHFGHGLGIGEINQLVSHLEKRDYVSVERLGEVVIVKLTRAGQDVAEGNVTADGIDRPSLEN